MKWVQFRVCRPCKLFKSVEQHYVINVMLMIASNGHQVQVVALNYFDCRLGLIEGAH